MKNVEDVTLTCGASSLIAFFVAGGPLDPPGAAGAAIGTGTGCFFTYVIHRGIW